MYDLHRQHGNIYPQDKVTLAEEILKIIGEVALVGGGAALIAFGAVKWFGKKWFEHQFAQRLESFKREQSEILEQYRYQINSRFNRITKIHEKEFEVLPEVWQRLQDAYGHFISLSSPLQSWPDLNKYSQPQLESFIEKCGLLDFQKDELRLAEDKFEYYTEKIYWIRLNAATKKFNEFRTYLRYNKIFLSRDLFDLFHQIELAMIDVEVQLEHPESSAPPDNKPWAGTGKPFQKLTKDVSALLDKVESAVQERLHFDQAQ